MKTHHKLLNALLMTLPLLTLKGSFLLDHSEPIKRSISSEYSEGEMPNQVQWDWQFKKSIELVDQEIEQFRETCLNQDKSKIPLIGEMISGCDSFQEFQYSLRKIKSRTAQQALIVYQEIQAVRRKAIEELLVYVSYDKNSIRSMVQEDFYLFRYDGKSSAMLLKRPLLFPHHDYAELELSNNDQKINLVFEQIRDSSTKVSSRDPYEVRLFHTELSKHGRGWNNALEILAIDQRKEKSHFSGSLIKHANILKIVEEANKERNKDIKNFVNACYSLDIEPYFVLIFSQNKSYLKLMKLKAGQTLEETRQQLYQDAALEWFRVRSGDAQFYHQNII